MQEKILNNRKTAWQCFFAFLGAVCRVYNMHRPRRDERQHSAAYRRHRVHLRGLAPVYGAEGAAPAGGARADACSATMPAR